MPLSVKARSGSAEAIPAPLPKGFERVIANVNAKTVGNLFGGLKSHVVGDANGWRIDRQNPPSGYANVQVQHNGTDGKSTVACVLIPDKYNIAMPTGPDATKAKRQLEHGARLNELAKVIRDGLMRSAKSYKPNAVNPTSNPGAITAFEVTGDFSAKIAK
jgi:hypothetical protein